MVLSLRRWFKKKGAVGLGRCRAESSGGAGIARLGGGSPYSSRFAAGSRNRVPSAWGAAEPRARSVLAERDLGAARHVLLASSLVQEKRRRRLGGRRAETSGGACRARLGGNSPCSSRFAASSRRRAPLSREFGRCLQSANWGRLAMSFLLRRWFKKKSAVGSRRSRAESSGGACRARLGGGSLSSSLFAASLKRRMPSAWVAAELRAWAALAERDLGAARHVLSLRR